MKVEQTVDSETRRVDYWSQTKGNAVLSVHKVRTFEPVGDATKVVEVIDGDAPFGIHLIAGRTARKAHIEHMDSYHKLFEEKLRLTPADWCSGLRRPCGATARRPRGERAPQPHRRRCR